MKIVRARDVPPPVRRSFYPEPFASRLGDRDKRKLGDLFGLSNFGVNLTRLGPGALSALRHSHASQDEFVYVLEGQLVLRDNDGEHALSAGDCVGFRAGDGNAHQLVNASDTDAWYLEVGDRSPGDQVNYPDDDLAAESVDGNWVFRHKDGSAYE